MSRNNNTQKEQLAKYSKSIEQVTDKDRFIKAIKTKEGIYWDVLYGAYRTKWTKEYFYKMIDLYLEQEKVSYELHN